MNNKIYDDINIRYRECQELDDKIANIKLHSSLSPQLEDGYTEISHEVLEQLVKCKFRNSYTLHIILFVLRKTWGWHKKIDAISHSQFCDSLQINKQSMIRALDESVRMNIVLKSKRSVKGINQYMFNKYYDTWNINTTLRDTTL